MGLMRCSIHFHTLTMGLYLRMARSGVWLAAPHPHKLVVQLLADFNKVRGVAIIIGQLLIMMVLNINHLTAQCIAEARRFNAVCHHRNIHMLSRFNQDLMLTILNLVQPLVLVIAKCVRGKVTNGRQHAADQIGIGQLVLLIQRLVPEQQPALPVDQKRFGYTKRQRVAQDQITLRDAV